MKKDLGKKLYKSKALMPFKVLFLSICIMLFINLYIQTYIDPDFLKNFEHSFWGVMNFHVAYPEQVISLILSTLIPTIYYAFIRGICFYEKGVLVNRGLPFMNHVIAYDDIQSYKIVHHKYLMSFMRKSLREELLFTVQDIDRAVAILDQHNIKGDLSNAEFHGGMTTSKKLIIFYIVFFIVVTILQFSGFFIYVNQWLFR